MITISFLKVDSLQKEETVEIQDQFIDEDQNENEYSVGATQRFVMAEKLFLDASYNFSSTSSTNTRYVYDLDQETNNYSNFNDLLSNDFESKSFKNIPNVGVNYEGQKWRVGSEIGLLNTTLENTNLLQDVSFGNTYNNFSCGLMSVMKLPGLKVFI
jgi:hypothetical protein